MINSIIPGLLKGLGSLHWAAVGFTLLAWAIERLDKKHQNYEDCHKLFRDTLFLLKQTKSMWESGHVSTAHQADLMKSNLPRIIEAALEVFLVVSFCTDRG